MLRDFLFVFLYPHTIHNVWSTNLFTFILFTFILRAT